MNSFIPVSDVTIGVRFGDPTNRVLSRQVKSQVFVLEVWILSFQRLSPLGSPSPNFQVVAGGVVNLKVEWGL